MTSQQLQCFVCAADKLNFTKAAEELYLSPPTVTHHIKSLEEEMKTTLFIRTSKMVRLTEAGTVFYSDAKEILSKMETAGKKVQDIAGQELLSLKIGCSSSAELSCLEKALHSLQIRYPHVYPHIFIDDYFKLKSLFNERHLDLVLATKEMTKDMTDCIFKKIKTLANCAVVSENSPLGKKETIYFKELEDERLIVIHPKFIPFQYGNKFQEKLAAHSQSHYTIVCENDQAGLMLTKCGYGTAILPEFCIPATTEDLAVIPICDDRHQIEYGIAYHKNYKNEYLKYLINSFSIS